LEELAVKVLISGIYLYCEKKKFSLLSYLLTQARFKNADVKVNLHGFCQN